LDLQRISDEQLQKNELSSMMTLALKYRQIRDFAVFLKKFLPQIYSLEKYSNGSYLARLVLQYIVDGVQSGNVELFKEHIQQLPKKLKGEAMTIAEQLREQGVQQGIRQGIQEGIQQGRQEGEVAMFMLLIQQRFGKIPANYMETITKADPKTLLSWGTKLLNAKTLEEIFYPL